MRVLFIGTGDIGLPSLEWLINTPKHEVVGVITQPDSHSPCSRITDSKRRGTAVRSCGRL